MNILFLGDIVAQDGCDFVSMKLPKLKKEYEIDFVIANGENSANNNGMTPGSITQLFESGVDFVTGGNHSFRRKEVYDFLDETPNVIRPANFPRCDVGCGYQKYDLGYTQILVVNLLGTTFMEPVDNPFVTIDNILKRETAPIILLDFHAEATSEKRAMGFFLDGRITAIFGTHTHVQTADAQILPKGTAYITDAGMTGPIQSVIGVKPETIIEGFLTRIHSRKEVMHGEMELNCVLLELDKNHKATKIKNLCIK